MKTKKSSDPENDFMHPNMFKRRNFSLSGHKSFSLVDVDDDVLTHLSANSTSNGIFSSRRGFGGRQRPNTQFKLRSLWAAAVPVGDDLCNNTSWSPPDESDTSSERLLSLLSLMGACCWRPLKIRRILLNLELRAPFFWKVEKQRSCWPLCPFL